MFDSVNTLLPNTQNMRQAARLLSLRGQVAIYDRDSSAARRSILALLGCSNTLAGEPILISQLVVVAIDSMAIAMLKSAIEQDVLSEADLKALLPEILAKTNIGPEWKQAMRGERGLMLPIFRNPNLVSADSKTNMLPGRSRDTLYYLDHIDGILAVPEDDFDTFKAGLEVQEAELRQLFSGGFLVSFDTILTGIAAPATAAAGNAFIRQAVEHRLAAMSIGARLFEKRTGQLPTKLDAVIAELKVDPSQLMPPGGRPFGYQTDEFGAQIWGFEMMREVSTPPEPPGGDEDDPQSEDNKRWIWQLRDAEK